MVLSDCAGSNNDCGWMMSRIMWMVVGVHYIVIYACRAEQSSTTERLYILYTWTVSTTSSVSICSNNMNEHSMIMALSKNNATLEALTFKQLNPI
jgi:hypothetical protein